MKNAIKTFIFIGLILMCSTLYAQVYERLPDNFTEKYSSSEDYHKTLEKEQREREEAAQAALLAEQKAREEEDVRNTLVVAFIYNNKSDTLLKYKKMFGGYFEIYSNEPYDEAYIVWRKSEDKYLYEIWHLTVKIEDDSISKCVLVNERLEDITKSYRYIVSFDENWSYERLYNLFVEIKEIYEG